MNPIKDPNELYSVARRVRHAARDGFRISEMALNPDQVIPWHSHDEVADTFYVLEGCIEVSVEEASGSISKVILKPDQIYQVAAGLPHHVANVGNALTTFFVMQKGHHNYRTKESNFVFNV